MSPTSILLLTLISTTYALATLFLLLRLISKLWVVKKISWDDAWLGLAWMMSGVISGMGIWGSLNGYGNGFEEIEERYLSMLRMTSFIFVLLYPLAITANKASVLILYISLAEAYPWLRIGSYIILSFTLTSAIVTSLVGFFECNLHISAAAALWDNPEIAQTIKCVDMRMVLLCTAPINFLCSVATTLLPLPLLSSLRMARGEKVWTMFAFGLGALVSVICIIRIVYLQDTILFQDAGDWEKLNYAQYMAYLFSIVEVNIGVITVSTVALKPLGRKLFGSYFSSELKTPKHRVAKHFLGLPDLVDCKESGSEKSAIPTTNICAATPVLLSHDGTGRRSFIRDLDEEEESSGGDMDLFDFLAMEAGSSPGPQPSPLSWSGSSDSHDCQEKRLGVRLEGGGAQQDLSSHEDFSDLSKLMPRESLARMGPKDSFKQVLSMSFLFFITGISFNLLSVLNKHSHSISAFTSMQNMAMSGAYWGSYLLAGFIGHPIVCSKYGFKGSILLGLGILCISTMIFWTSSIIESFASGMVSTVMYGGGIALIQMGAYPVVALAGSDAGSLPEARLNFATGFIGLSTLLASLLCRLVYDGMENRAFILDAQWAYLSTGLVAIFALIAVFYFRLGEISNADLEERAAHRFRRSPAHDSQTTFGIRTKTIVAVLAVLYIFLFSGTGVTMGQYKDNLISYHDQGATDHFFLVYDSVYDVICTLSSFTTAFLCYKGLSTKIILRIAIVGTMISMLLATLPSSSRDLSKVGFLFYAAFTTPIFPMLFGIALRGMGANTKTLSTILIASQCGSSILPNVTLALVQDGYSLPVCISWTVGMGLLLLVLMTGLSYIPSIRTWLEPSLMDEDAKTMRSDSTAQSETGAQSVGEREAQETRAREGLGLGVAMLNSEVVPLAAMQESEKGMQ